MAPMSSRKASSRWRPRLTDDTPTPAPTPTPSVAAQVFIQAGLAAGGTGNTLDPQNATAFSVTISERGATRMDDRTSDASMERRKKEGYF